MRWRKFIGRAGAALGVLGLGATAAVAADKPGGIVAIGGSVTEIIYALGAQDRLVARDTTSTFPVAAQALPDVGYMRALSPEGVLSVGPRVIIAEEGAGPPETIAVLQAANVPFVTVPEDYSIAGIAVKVQAVGAAIDEPARAQALADQIRRDLSLATEQAQTEAGGPRKSVLFILSTQGGRIMASGRDTAAAAMIDLAGGTNAVTAFSGYKPMTDEAVLAANPDVILMMDRGGDHDSTIADLVALPAIAPTPAGQARAVVRMDGLYLLGFGPRTAAAITDLNTALYGG
tara:strand:+ start:32860 stop:33726 length:867 start_codon:yes stop_codon:yes gene_type:complete